MLWPRSAVWGIALLTAALLAACGSAARPATATRAPSAAAATRASGPQASPTSSASPPPSATASATPSPTATASPMPTSTPTPRPTPTLVPNGVGHTDDLGDPIYCINGKPAFRWLPAGLDLWYAAMVAEADPDEEGRCYWVVTVLFAEPIGRTALAGGVEFYHPDAPRRQPPSKTWFFDNIAYLSLNFAWSPQDAALTTWAEKIYQGRWIRTRTITGYTGQVDPQGRLVLRIPCDAVRPGSTWMVAATGEQGTVCDALGLDENGLPALPLPPTPTP